EVGCDLHERWMVDRCLGADVLYGLCSAVGDLVDCEAGLGQHRLVGADEPVPVDKLEDPGAGDLQADLAFVSVTVASAGLAAAEGRERYSCGRRVAIDDEESAGRCKHSGEL